MKSAVKKIIINTLSVLLVIAIFYFLGKQFANDWDKIKTFSFDFNSNLLTLSVVLYSITFFFLALGLHFILKFFHKPIPLREGLLYFCITQPAKYIPGKIWIAVARMKFLKRTMCLIRSPSRHRHRIRDGNFCRRIYFSRSNSANRHI